MGQRRYPGATPFRKEQSRIFYGRDRDIEKMLTLIKVEKKVLLYSKSGLGKTSLLEAGVIPRLPGQYKPVSIRFLASKSEDVSPITRVINFLEKSISRIDDIPETLLDHLENKNEIRGSLWAYFKKLQLSGLAKDKDGKNQIFLLVFDQFEELFSYTNAEIEAFKNEIYDISQHKIPDRFMKQIARSRRNNRELFNSEAIENLQESLNIKIVFAIRSDRLSFINNLSDKIPDIQNIFYEIKPLDESQAREAIVKPAMDDDPSFETKPYIFHKDAINEIIKKLTKDGEQNIETTQLQIVCHRIEEIAEEKHLQQNADDPLEILINHLPKFKNIFLDFYNDSIEKIPEDSRLKAKRLIEDEMIRNGQRISLDENICKEYIDEVNLKKLVDTHLLRAEPNSFGRYSFELSHDTLVEPILESKKKFQDQQERLRLEKERQEELKKVKKEQEQKDKERRKKLHIQRIISAIVTIFLLVSLGLGYWGFMNFCNASEQRDKALVKEQEANKNLIDFKNAQFEDYFDNGNDAMLDARYDLAIRNYNLARDWVHADISISITDTGYDCNIFSEIFSNRVKDEMPKAIAAEVEQKKQAAINDSIRKIQQVNDSIQRCRVLAANAEHIRNLLSQASELLNRKQYVEALSYYKQAYREDPNRKQNRRKFLEAKSQAERMYEKNKRDYAEIGDISEINRADSLLRLVRSIQL